jgi:hypothetical protein
MLDRREESGGWIQAEGKLPRNSGFRSLAPNYLASNYPGAGPEIGFVGAPLLSSICFVFLRLPAKSGSFGKTGCAAIRGSAKCPKLVLGSFRTTGFGRNCTRSAAWPAAIARCAGECAFLTYFYCRTEIPTKQA